MRVSSYVSWLPFAVASLATCAHGFTFIPDEDFFTPDGSGTSFPSSDHSYSYAPIPGPSPAPPNCPAVDPEQCEAKSQEPSSSPSSLPSATPSTPPTATPSASPSSKPPSESPSPSLNYSYEPTSESPSPSTTYVPVPSPSTPSYSYSPVYETYSPVVASYSYSPVVRTRGLAEGLTQPVVFEGCGEITDPCNTTNKRQTQCPGFAHVTKWEPGDNQDDGLIIQKVCNTVSGDRCGGPKPEPVFVKCTNKGECIRHPVTGKYCYFELWRVKEGSVYAFDVWNDTALDERDPKCQESLDWFAHLGFRNTCRTCGVFDQEGISFFIPDDKWLPRRRDFELTFKTGGGGVSNACDLASVCWTQLIENDLYSIATGLPTLKKRVKREWNCCFPNCEDKTCGFETPPIGAGPPIP